MRIEVGDAPERKTADRTRMATLCQRKGTKMNSQLPTRESFPDLEEPKAMLTKHELRELSRISTMRSALHIIIEWMLILAAIRVCERFWEPWLYLATIVVIATRQHSLMIMLH